MLKIKKFVGSRTGVIILSIILGLGLSSIFKMSCDTNDCIVYTGPNFDESNIIKYNNKCYEAHANMETCNTNKNIINV
jgi:hypothetical protein